MLPGQLDPAGCCPLCSEGSRKQSGQLFLGGLGDCQALCSEVDVREDRRTQG